MKKVGLFTVLMITFTIVSGQKSIDNLFDKYAGKDGFTTVTINGNLLKLASFFDHDEKDEALPANISLIRILAQEDESIKTDNFYDMVINDIDLNNYEEFMRVKDSDQDMRMLVRTDGNIFKEFLLVAGGKNNALIQVKGNMSFKEAKKFSEDAKKNHGSDFVADHK
jgi:hypothetical protein